MSTKSAEPGALERVQQLRAKFEAESPKFREASYRERRAEAFCDRARNDLKRQRKALKWEQTQLGAALGYSQSAISKIESGQTELTLDLFFKLADALGLRPVVAYVPAARTLANETVKTGSPERERVTISASAIEDAQAEMIRKMPLFMQQAMANIVSAESEDAEAEAPVFAMDAG